MTKEQLDDIRARLDGGLQPLPSQGYALLDEVERLKAQNLAMLRVIAKQQEKVESIHEGTPKCKSADCWLCHGVPENAGPR
jgi:hypothetical protein